ncbi:MAG: molybdopterin cofactor-binding domain-containing protein [Acidimicrobiales bacterium]
MTSSRRVSPAAPRVTETRDGTRLGIGESAARPDGIPKVKGQFAYSSDLWAEGMLWGATVRSPLPRARIASIDPSEARSCSGVHAVLTHEDVPGRKTFGLEVPDQPVLAWNDVRYEGEPVALVAADHPETARRAAEKLTVDYEELPPLTDPEDALGDGAPKLHPSGNVIRHVRIRHGDERARAEVVVSGTYEVGMQDQAFLGPESGLAVPDGDGGVDLWVATQWLHEDRDQVAACLGLTPNEVRLHLGGVGGAFGGREDVSMQVHACLLALTSGHPVKMSYLRDESFLGHVHRHPARLRYRHHATRRGDLVKVEAELVLDGGAYASSSTAVLANACCFAAGPYRAPNALVEGWAVRTNNPPCGAMRGFGAVQACFAYEAQMDKLAAALGIDAVELRLRNALAPGDRIITGQVIRGTAPVAEVIRTCAGAPLPALPPPAGAEEMALPGGAGRTADPSEVRRGVGFAVSVKNLMFSEGFDDYAIASCRLEGGVATIKSACAEVGQGFVTLAQQIAREVLGVDEVVVAPADTSIGSAGSTSASRQSWMSGSAVQAACEAVRARLVEAAPGDVIEETVTFRHAPTQPLDENGQGDAHVSFAFAAHRAVVDVDLDLGLVRVLDITTSQDVGRVLNPLQCVGQIEGGIAQGVGLAVMEELVLDRGRILNPSFTDYLIPTALDMPDVHIAALIEQPEPGGPFGAKGVGEPPTISSTAAVVAAIRAATGLPLTRVPVRPQDIALPGAPRR